MRLELIVPVGDRLAIVTSQPFIHGRDATIAEIDAYMRDVKGFEKLGEMTYYLSSGGILASDLGSSNVKISSHDGIVHPFDPIVQRITPDFAGFLRGNPHLLENIRFLRQSAGAR